MGWHLSRSGKATTAASALEHALITRFGTLGRVTQEFLLRSDNGLVFTSRKFTALVRSYGLKQEFITPHCPQQTDVIEQPRSAAFANFMFEHLVTPEAELASAFVASVA
ncbi:hypothetical protein [Gemmobacter fulva]|uniref:hypothetical protein n=1 Tax=Gemmobacter fulvus TaxID=2840474 RepID=UPI0021B0D11B|nr:hypothetical protein [Gemmobacter fulvus]